MDATQAQAQADQASTGEVRMTMDEAIAEGIRRHQAQEFAHARRIYEAVLQHDPERVEVLNVLGILEFECGHVDTAIALMERLLDLKPEADGVWNNLGNALLRKGNLDGAAMAFKRSLQLVPSAEAWANLARVFLRLEDYAVSALASRQALELVPDHPVALHNLAIALLCQRQTEEGVEVALKAMRLLPPRARRRQVYVIVLQLAGELEAAATVLRAWQAEDPENAYVRHHLAACTGDAIPERASDHYVEDEFDGFAPSFDAKLADLKYSAPPRVADAVAAAFPAPAAQLDIADLGCGTGLCGPLLRPWARSLVGCDLSGGMLELAERRGSYDALTKEELTAFMHARPDAFDVVVSADTLIYFGELGAVAQGLHGTLHPGGLAVFTLEALPADETAPYRLQPHGRYAHNAAYVTSVFEAAGMSMAAPVSVVLREENHRPVQGWLLVARRS